MRANRIRSFVLRTAGAMTLGALATVPAFADTSESGGLDEVVVQARKFAENLQDVPLSISVFSAEDIERQNISSNEDVARLDPSVIFDYGASLQDTRIVIRGLSPTRGRVNSAVLIDGIDITSESIQFAGGGLLATGKLFDLQQIEIVKGPQAALYGRSAFAGAISYTTKDPAKEFGAEVRLDGSEKGRYFAGVGLDLPVNDDFGVRVSGTYYNRDSIYKNVALNAGVGASDGYGLAITSKWQATENFSARLRIDYADDKSDVRAQYYLRANTRLDPAAANLCANAAARTASTTCVFTGTGINPTTGAVGSQTRLFYWGSTGRYSDIGSPRPNMTPDPKTGQMYPGSELKTFRANLKLEWKLAQGTLTSLTGLTDSDTFASEDLDHDSVWNGTIDTANRLSAFTTKTKTKQFNEELRYRSDLEGPLNFTVGGQLFKADDDNKTNSLSMSCFPAFFNCGFPPFIPTVTAYSQVARLNVLDRFWGRSLDHRSFYGMLEFKPTDRWEFEIEGRHSKESESIYGPICDPANTSLAFGFPLACADATTTAAGSPFPPGTPGVVFPFTVDFPSSTLLYSPLTAAGVRQQTSVTGHAPDYDSSFTTYRAYALFKAAENVNLYATVGRSVKPGGRSTVTAGNWLDGNYDGVFDDSLYGPEKLISYELGAKMQWLDNRLRTNFALFRQDYTQKQIGTQVLTPNGTPVGRVINAGKAKVNGLEANIEWRATERLTVAAAYSYLDAKYTDFKFRSNSATDAIRFGDCTRAAVTVTPVSGPPVTSYFCDIDALKNRSLRLEDVPKHSASVSAHYEIPLSAFGGAKFYIEGDSQIQTERTVDPANRRWVEDYVQANVRLGLQGERWEAELYVNNITDDDTILSAQDNPGDVDASINTPNAFGPTDGLIITLPDPRIVGVRFNWRFGGGK